MTGRYRAYPEYKDSGVEWLGEVPAHWNIQPLLTVCNFQSGKAHEPFIDDDGEYVCVNSRYVSTEGASKKFCNKNLSPARENDILMVMSDLPNGRALAKAYYVKAEENLAVNQRVCILSAVKAYPRFLFYLLDRNQLFLMHDDGVNQTHLSNALFTKFPTTIPPEQEQILIANFLDHETAKIDTLIEKQQQLIQLLKEKRQAVISHAITKGLNPDVRMKDSGVEWLGEVPEHWVICSLKNYASVIDCKHITAEFLDDGFPVASIGEVKEWFVNLTSAKFTSEKFYRDLIGGGRKPVAGDIIYSRNATVGEAALVSPGMPDFAMGQDVCLIRLERKLSPEYIMHALKSPVIYRQLELAMVGSTFKRINVDDIRNFNLAAPPIDEQIEIVEQLEMLLTKYDKIIYGAQESIGLMQERRTALISAAVTGKIDVRLHASHPAGDLQPSKSSIHGNL